MRSAAIDAHTGVAQLVPPKLSPRSACRLPGAATAGASWSACGLVGFLYELDDEMSSLQRSPSPSFRTLPTPMKL